MKILVIGGTRDFGKITVRKLLERGDNVTVYSRGNVKPEFWNDVDHIAGDRTDHVEFIKSLKNKKYDVVIDNVACHMPADGSVWITNNTKYHNAFNGGEEDRIHLVACVLNYKFN